VLQRQQARTVGAAAAAAAQQQQQQQQETKMTGACRWQLQQLHWLHWMTLLLLLPLPEHVGLQQAGSHKVAAAMTALLLQQQCAPATPVMRAATSLTLTVCSVATATSTSSNTAAC
jgi:nucleoside phosphorylase